MWLEIVGLLALVAAGLLLAPALGLAVLGVACLYMAWVRARS